MRFVGAAVVALGCIRQAMSEAKKDFCDELCKLHRGCDRAKGSYCNIVNDPPTCHDYYFTTPNRHAAYYYREGGFGYRDIPVLCSDAEGMVNSKPDEDYCVALCSINIVCKNDETGSYADVSIKPVICHGFFLTDPEASGYSYLTHPDEGDLSRPMTHEQAKYFYENHTSSNTLLRRGLLDEEDTTTTTEEETATTTEGEEEDTSTTTEFEFFSRLLR
jgi:hypothetical protein